MKTFGMIARVAVVTVLFGILGFALGGLIALLSLSAMRAAGVPLNLLYALRFGGIPGGALGAMVGLAIISVSERRERQRASAIR